MLWMDTVAERGELKSDEGGRGMGLWQWRRRGRDGSFQLMQRWERGHVMLLGCGSGCCAGRLIAIVHWMTISKGFTDVLRWFSNTGTAVWLRKPLRTGIVNTRPTTRGQHVCLALEGQTRRMASRLDLTCAFVTSTAHAIDECHSSKSNRRATDLAMMPTIVEVSRTGVSEPPSSSV